MFLTSSIIADFLLLGILGLILGHGFFLHRQRRWLLFDPLNAFWGGVLVVYVEQPISNAAALIGYHGEELFCRTLAWVLFGLVCVVLGYETRWGAACARKLPKLSGNLSPSRVTLAACALILLALASYAYDMYAAGGPQVWLSFGRGGTDLEKGSNYFRELQNLLPVGIAILLFQVEMQPVPVLMRFAAWASGVLMLMWFVYLGTRSHTIMFTMALMTAWFLPRRKNPSFLVLAPLFVGLWMLVTFIGMYRWQFSNLSLHLDLVDWNEFEEAVLPYGMDDGENVLPADVPAMLEFNCVMTVIKLVPDTVDYNYGYGHLEIFTRAIPRSIWPNKRYPLMESEQGVFYQGHLTEQTTLYNDLLCGPAFTFVGHWWYVFGPIGLAFGGLLTGFVFRMFREYYEVSGRSFAATLIYLQLIYTGFNDSAATPFYWLITLSLPLLALYLLIYFCRERPELPVAGFRALAIAGRGR